MKMQIDTKGAGRPVVMVGGGLTGWLSFIPHQQRLMGSREVTRAQLLSVQLGLESRPLPKNYSVKLESSALAAALDARELRDPVDLVAWSYGALVTLDFALDHPERVRTLTLIEPPAYWVLDALDMLDERALRDREELEALGAETTSDVTAAQLATFVRSVGLCPPDKEPSELSAWPQWLEHRRSLRQTAKVLEHRDDAARLRSFQRPVLLVKGTGSTYGLHRILDALASVLPRVQTIELPGGHAPQIAAMDDFLARLAAFQENP
jgi:pimeloyl-ACP methyl ester carboxylesterase